MVDLEPKCTTFDDPVCSFQLQGNIKLKHIVFVWVGTIKSNERGRCNLW